MKTRKNYNIYRLSKDSLFAAVTTIILCRFPTIRVIMISNNFDIVWTLDTEKKAEKFHDREKEKE